MLLCTVTLHSEEKSAQQNPPRTTPYVSKIRFSGNKAVSEDELRQIMVTSEQSSFLGLGLFGGARKPFNSEEFNKDILLLKKFYTYKGYFFASMDTTIVHRPGGKKVDLSILIHENEPTRVDSLNYEGLHTISGELKQHYLSNQRLKVNDIFSVERLIEERDRTLSFFRQYGYAFFHEDSIRIKVDTVGTRAGVLYRISLPERLKYAAIKAVVHNPVKNESHEREKIFTQDNIHGIILGKQNISPKLITSAIEFRPGEVTNQTLEQRSLQNLGATNIFSSIYIRADSTKSGQLYTTVHLETTPKHQIEPKILADNRYGDLFFGASLAYENKNLLGGAERFNSSIEYGSQFGYSKNLLANLREDQYTKVIPFEFNLKSSLVMPVLRKPGNFYSTTLQYSAAKLPVLLSSKSGLIRETYSAQLGPSSRLNFDFFEFEWVQKDSLKGFKQLFKTDLAKNIGIDPTNELRTKAGIDSLLETHINQTFRLRYNYTNRQKVMPEKTIWNLDLLVEESGSLSWLIDKYIDTRSYSGFTNRDPQIFGIAYSQYVKVEPNLVFTKNVTQQSQFAGKLHAGWMTPYGKADATPEERRFYTGGPSSMRGWLFNTLGPGSNKSDALSNFGANIKLELGMEYRLKFFKFFSQPSGITLFTDLGNIWDNSGPYGFSLGSLTKDFAWDTGVGMRLGSPIGPFRFDFAYKIHDPSESRPWRISTWRLSDYTFNFGIGEAF